jgi:hypothetical protein
MQLTLVALQPLAAHGAVLPPFAAPVGRGANGVAAMA